MRVGAVEVQGTSPDMRAARSARLVRFVGKLPGQPLPVGEMDPVERRAAQLTVARNAHNKTDLRFLLDVLGLLA